MLCAHDDPSTNCVLIPAPDSTALRGSALPPSSALRPLLPSPAIRRFGACIGAEFCLLSESRAAAGLLEPSSPLQHPEPPAHLLPGSQQCCHRHGRGGGERGPASPALSARAERAALPCHLCTRQRGENRQLAGGLGLTRPPPIELLPPCRLARTRRRPRRSCPRRRRSQAPRPCSQLMRSRQPSSHFKQLTPRHLCR